MRKILLSLLLAAVTSGLALADDGKPFPHIGRRICVLILSVSTAAAFMIIISLMPGSGSRITVNTPSTALT